MATIQPTYTTVGAGNYAARLVTWTPVTENDTCQAVSIPDLTDRSVHVSGTFGGATVVIQGSNIVGGTTYVSLNDSGGTAISITTEKMKVILENSLLIRPSASGGTGQSLTINILFHLSQALRA